jgi:hypothetical protein
MTSDVVAGTQDRSTLRVLGRAAALAKNLITVVDAESPRTRRGAVLGRAMLAVDAESPRTRRGVVL